MPADIDRIDIYRDLHDFEVAGIRFQGETTVSWQSDGNLMIHDQGIDMGGEKYDNTIILSAGAIKAIVGYYKDDARPAKADFQTPAKDRTE